MEGGPYQEYFAIEIPIITIASTRPSETIAQVPSSITAEGISDIAIGISETAIGISRCSGHRRFVFVKEEQSASFPMQFGLEVGCGSMSVSIMLVMSTCITIYLSYHIYLSYLSIISIYLQSCMHCTSMYLSIHHHLTL